MSFNFRPDVLSFKSDLRSDEKSHKRKNKVCDEPCTRCCWGPSWPDPTPRGRGLQRDGAAPSRSGCKHCWRTHLETTREENEWVRRPISCSYSSAGQWTRASCACTGGGQTRSAPSGALELITLHSSSLALQLTVLSTIHLISIMLPMLVIFSSCSCWMCGGGGGKVTSGVR